MLLPAAFESVPVILLTGFLNSGKTTVKVNAITEHRPRHRSWRVRRAGRSLAHSALMDNSSWSSGCR